MNTDTLSGIAPAPAAPAPALPSFQRQPGETPRAFGAFVAFFELGHGRSLRAVASRLGENVLTLKKWSSKYRWRERLQEYQSGRLQARAAADAALPPSPAADWSRRSGECREQAWLAAQKLQAAALCFLETFGDREVEKMSLAHVSRALQIAAQLSRQALPDAPVADAAAPSALESALAAALQKAYAPADPADPPASPAPPTN